jgi:hypothetical protein
MLLCKRNQFSFLNILRGYFAIIDVATTELFPGIEAAMLVLAEVCSGDAMATVRQGDQLGIQGYG